MSINLAAANYIEGQILALSKCGKEELDDAALELQVDLEMWRYDEKAVNPNLPRYEPYQDFAAFAGAAGLDFSDTPGSALFDMTPEQVKLACAWNFLGASRDMLNDKACERLGWNLDERLEYARRHLLAADRLVTEVQLLSPRAVH